MKTLISAIFLISTTLAPLASAQNPKIFKPKNTTPQNHAQTSPKPTSNYNCQSQLKPFPNQQNVSLSVALKLVQQREGNIFVYHCYPTTNAASVTGTLTYRQRIALPPKATIEIKLIDISRADAPAIPIAQQTITTTGEQVPIPFNLNYDPNKINPNNRYAVQARILINREMRWINTTQYEVLTQGKPTKIEIIVEPVSSPTGQTENNTPVSIKTPGWGTWQPISEIEKYNISAGFSNSELGGYMDFQNSCAETLGKQRDDFPNWFRLDNLVNQIGTGNIEYGCWHNGKFINTMTMTAMKNDLKTPYCLQVIANELIIYSDLEPKSKQIRRLKAKDKIEPLSLPAIIVEKNGENWIAINKPVEGWVLHGRTDTQGNLRLCP